MVYFCGNFDRRKREGISRRLEWYCNLVQYECHARIAKFAHENASIDFIS